MVKPTLHLVGIFHTIHNQAYSHCAFTGKALRFARMLQLYDYDVVEYANEGSESEAKEKVVMLSQKELQALTGDRHASAFYADLAETGKPWHTLFEIRLVQELKKRVQPRDIICHPFGHAHSRLLDEFPNNKHVETGIGYNTLMPTALHIFETYAWRHYHCGKDQRWGSNYEWVIPNYFEINDWEPNYTPGDYIAFLGRIDSCKGLDTIYELASYVDKKIVLCGQGDHTRWAHPNIEYRGPISGRERSEFLRNALCSLMPTSFIEPFGGSGVEGLLCGTPLIATDYGAFTETVQNGVNGYRCKTLRDWVEAIERVGDLDRKTIADNARNTYSLEACGLKYAKAFEQIYELYDAGWYSLPEHIKARKKPTK